MWHRAPGAQSLWICPHISDPALSGGPFLLWLQVQHHFLQEFCAQRGPICLFSSCWNRPSTALKVLTGYFCDPCIKNQLWATLWILQNWGCKLSISQTTIATVANLFLAHHLLDVCQMGSCGQMSYKCEVLLHLTFLPDCKAGPMNPQKNSVSEQHRTLHSQSFHRCGCVSEWMLFVPCRFHSCLSSSGMDGWMKSLPACVNP